MMVYEIPLAPQPQAFSIVFPNGATYNLRLIYLFTPDACWELDIADAFGVPLVQGIPLVTGADLLAQYATLDFGCALYCTTDGDPDAVPNSANLGAAGLGPRAHLWLAA